MARINMKTSSTTKTHEDGKAIILPPEKELMRVVMTCMLLENTFYEKGSDVAERIKELCKKVRPGYLAELAIIARRDMHLRSVSLFLARELARNTTGPIVSNIICEVIQRADELSEFLAMYFMDGKQPLSKQTKLGLAKAFGKFDEYQLAKYNRNNTQVKLKDVLFLCHAKPKDEEQQNLWERLIDDELKIPDTWETQLSSGKDKKDTFERLIKEKKLGYMALLRNLRNMEESGCDQDLISEALLDTESIKKSRVLPFRFLAAYRNISNTRMSRAIKDAFLASIDNLPELEGISTILVDVSGSMSAPVSNRSQISCLDAAACLGAILKHKNKAMVYSFSNELCKITSNKSGIDLIDDITNSQANYGTYLGRALDKVNGDPCQRVLVLTDEQSHDTIPRCWAKNGYIVNLCGYKPSLGYAGNWEMIAGWSDKLIDYICKIEEWDKTNN